MSISPVSLHAEALHLRAKVARTEAVLAAERLCTALLDFVVTPACAPGDAPLVTAAIRWLRPESVPFDPVGGLAMPDMSNFMAARSDSLREHYHLFIESKKAAMDLTEAAQLLSFRTSLA
jgi:hypothetical protein